MTENKWVMDVIAVWKHTSNGIQLHLRRDGSSFQKWRNKETGLWDAQENAWPITSIEKIEEWITETDSKFVRVVKIKETV